MMSRSGYLLATALLLAVAGTARAQIIWQAPSLSYPGTYTGNNSDISNLGTFVSAVYENNTHSGTPITVTGTDTIFDYQTDLHITGLGGGGTDGSHSTATPYQQALDGVAYVYVPGTTTFSLTGLNATHNYQVQIWDVDASTSRTTQFSTTGPGGTTSATTHHGYVIGNLTGVTSETITWQGTMNGGVGEINAVELRDITNVPEPSTYAMMVGGLALLGFCVHRKLVRP